MKRSNLAHSFSKTLLVTLSMLASPLVLGEVCRFGGEYVWSEQGKNFVDVGGNVEVVDLVEVGKFTANIDGTMTGASKAVFNLPSNIWVHVSIEYRNGTFTFNNNDCAGDGNWECEATLLSTPSLLPPSVVEGLVEGLCAQSISFSFVTSKRGKNADFIITTPRIVSSGNATRVQRPHNDLR